MAASRTSLQCPKKRSTSSGVRCAQAISGAGAASMPVLLAERLAYSLGRSRGPGMQHRPLQASGARAIRAPAPLRCWFCRRNDSHYSPGREEGRECNRMVILLRRLWELPVYPNVFVLTGWSKFTVLLRWKAKLLIRWVSTLLVKSPKFGCRSQTVHPARIACAGKSRINPASSRSMSSASEFLHLFASRFSLLVDLPEGRTMLSIG